MGEQNRDLILAIGWLEHLERGLERSVRQRDARAIRTALGIARRRMKLQRVGKAVKSGPEREGYPITIFSAAIKELEKRGRGGSDGS